MGNSLGQIAAPSDPWRTSLPPPPPQNMEFNRYGTKDIYINPLHENEDLDQFDPREKTSTYDRLPVITQHRDDYTVRPDHLRRGSMDQNPLATLRRLSFEDRQRRVEYVPKPVVDFESSKLTSNYNALYYLARSGRTEMFTHMWKNYRQNHNEGIILHRAVMNNHYELLEALVKHGIGLDSLDPKGATALYYAVDNGHTPCAKILLENGAVTRVNEDIEPGRSVLYTAAKRGNADVVKMALAAKVPVDTAGKYDYTALHVAADSGHVDVVDILLNSGASIDKLTLSDRTAFEVATHNKKLEVARTFIDRGANIHRFDTHERSILHWAAGSPDPEIVRFLLDSGACVSLANKDGTMAHHVAARIGRSKNLHVLLMRKAPMNAVRKVEGQQRTALVDAIDAKRYQSAVVLLMHGAYPSTPQADDTDLLYSVANVCAHDPKAFGGHLIEAILFSGHFLSTRMAIADVTNIMNLYADLGAWYRSLLREPLQLKNMCRAQIRSWLITNARGYSIWGDVQSLNAPENVRNYLLLKECDMDRMTDEC